VSSTVCVNVLVGWLWCGLEPRAGRLGGRGSSIGRELAGVRVGTLVVVEKHGLSAASSLLFRRGAVAGRCESHCEGGDVKRLRSSVVLYSRSD
jgi:hypothetical protein